MSNHHNHNPVPTPELSPETKAILDIEKLNEWRARQHETLNELRLTHDGDELSREFGSGIDADLNDYLENHGIDVADPAYPEVYRVYRQASVDRIKDTEWSNRPSSRGVRAYDDRAQEDVYAERIADMRDSDNEPELDPNNPDSPDGDNPEEEQRIERLEVLRKAKQEAYADRVNTRWYDINGRKKTDEVYEQAREEYSRALMDDIRIRIEETLGDSVPPEQREQNIKEFADELINAEAAQEHEALMRRGGKLAEIRARYDKLSLWQKLGAGALGAVGAAGVGFMAGAIGAGVAAGVAAGAGVKYGYSHFWAKSRLYREPSSDSSFTYDKSEGADPAEKQIVEHINHRSDQRIEKGDNVKKKAFFVGLGSAAFVGAGGAVGMMAHINWFDMPSTDGRASDLWRKTELRGNHWRGGMIEHWLDNDASAHPDSGTEGASVDERESALGSEEGIDGEEARDLGADLGLEDRDTGSAPEVDDQPEFEVPEYVVSSGEGFFTTFENLGVDEANRLELLKDIGPQLEEMGVAYRMPDGLWGISAPGELPHEAVELIMSSASENGWLIDSAPSAEVYGVNEPFAVESEHGYTHELIDAAAAQGTDMTPEQAWAAHTTIVDAVGSDYIDLHDVNGADTYSMGASAYETGIASPSSDATWSAEAQPLIADAIDDGVINGSVDISDISPAEVAETTAAEPANEVITTTDDTGVDVDDESLNPSEAYDDAGVEAQLTAVEKAFANERISDLIDSGNYQLLNQFDAPGVDISQLAEQFAGMNYSDGTPLVEPASGGGMQFNEQPDGARLPNQAIDRINSFLEQAGLETYSYDKFNQAAAASAGRP